MGSSDLGLVGPVESVELIALVGPHGLPALIRPVESTTTASLVVYLRKLQQRMIHFRYIPRDLPRDPRMTPPSLHKISPAAEIRFALKGREVISNSSDKYVFPKQSKWFCNGGKALIQCPFVTHRIYLCVFLFPCRGATPAGAAPPQGCYPCRGVR